MAIGTAFVKMAYGLSALCGCQGTAEALTNDR
jgi:hypothetical protein